MKVSNYPILQEVNDDIDALCDLVNELRETTEKKEEEIKVLKEKMWELEHPAIQ